MTSPALFPIAETSVSIAMATALAGLTPYRMRGLILGPAPRVRSAIVGGRRLVDLSNALTLARRADWSRA